MMKFSLGKVVVTPGALEAFQAANQNLVELVFMHASGDWGDMPEEDKDQNEEALRQSGRLMSSYSTKSGEEIWIITEWDRSVTTVLLPEEY